MVLTFFVLNFDNYFMRIKIGCKNTIVYLKTFCYLETIFFSYSFKMKSSVIPAR